MKADCSALPQSPQKYSDFLLPAAARPHILGFIKCVHSWESLLPQRCPHLMTFIVNISEMGTEWFWDL